MFKSNIHNVQELVQCPEFLGGGTHLRKLLEFEIFEDALFVWRRSTGASICLSASVLPPLLSYDTGYDVSFNPFETPPEQRNNTRKPRESCTGSFHVRETTRSYEVVNAFARKGFKTCAAVCLVYIPYSLLVST